MIWLSSPRVVISRRTAARISPTWAPARRPRLRRWPPPRATGPPRHAPSRRYARPAAAHPAIASRRSRPRPGLRRRPPRNRDRHHRRAPLRSRRLAPADWSGRRCRRRSGDLADPGRMAFQSLDHRDAGQLPLGVEADGLDRSVDGRAGFRQQGLEHFGPLPDASARSRAWPKLTLMAVTAARDS